MITTLLIKTDKKLKEAAQDIVREMGLPLSAYINEQLRELVSRRQAVFRAPLVPNAKTARMLRKRLKDLDEGKSVAGPFKTGKEMDAWLNS